MLYGLLILFQFKIARQVKRSGLENLSWYISKYESVK